MIELTDNQKARIIRDAFRKEPRLYPDQNNLTRFSRECAHYIDAFLEETDAETRDIIVYRYCHEPPLSYAMIALREQVSRQAISDRFGYIRKKIWRYVCLQRYQLDAPAEALGIPMISKTAKFHDLNFKVRDVLTVGSERLITEYGVPQKAYLLLDRKLRSMNQILR